MPANFRDVLTLVINADPTKANKGLKSFASTAVKAFAAIGGALLIKNAFKAIIDAATETEKVYTSLAVSIDNSGLSFKKIEPVIRRFTDRVQTATGISDELVAEGLKLATQFGINLPDAMRVTEAALDISIARNISLATAVDLLGKAFIGDTALLKRYGIIIDESIPKAERFEAVMTKVNKQFGGQAAKQIETYAGQVSLLGQRWGDFLEKAGKPVLELLTDLLNKFNLMHDVFQADQIPILQKVILLWNLLNNDFGLATVSAQKVIDKLKAQQQALDDLAIANAGFLQQGGSAKLIALNDAAFEHTKKLFAEMAFEIKNFGLARDDALKFTPELQAQVDKFVSAEARALRKVQGLNLQWSDDFEEQAQRRLDFFIDISNSMVDLVFANVQNTVVAWVDGRAKLSDIWRNMALDFVSLFISEILKATKLKAVAGIVGILGSIFDKASNDAVAMRQGRHYAELWMSGAMNSFQTFLPDIPDIAPSGASVQASSGGTINITAPITSRFFSEGLIDLENIARRKGMQLNRRSLSVMQIATPRFI